MQHQREFVLSPAAHFQMNPFYIKTNPIKIDIHFINSCDKDICTSITVDTNMGDNNTDTKHNSSSIYNLKINAPPNNFLHNDDISTNPKIIIKTSSDQNITTETYTAFQILNI